MKKLILQLKPEDMPDALFWSLVALGVVIGVPAGAFGLWVLFTQIQFL
jgi:hypothetical protein